LIGAAVAVVAALWLGGDRRLRPLKLITEDDGRLACVALQYTREASPYTLPCLRAFLRGLDPSVEVIAVCGDQADEAAARKDLSLPGRTLKTVVVGKHITGWCKDRFLVAEGSPALLCRPPDENTGMPTRANDALVAPALARAFPGRFKDRVVPLKFDAGDILPCGQELIVSDTLWVKNGRPRDFQKRLEQIFDARVVWLHDVPDHHVGMYAAPVSGDEIIVGDPDLAKPLWTKAMEARLGKADFSPATVALFHNAATQLEAAGFKVVRAPTVPLGPQTFISYTNGVFEKGVVYMPTYACPPLDDLGRAAYRSVGRNAVPIPVETVYRFKGTIGCLINVLARS
jgi:hypothetical protein